MNAGNKYERIRMQTLTGRDIEAAVLEKAAVNLRRAQQSMKPNRINDEVESALDFNKRIWDVLRADWQNPDCHLPRALRENLLSLSVFISKQMLELRADPQPSKLDVFIRINETLVQGLRGRLAEASEAHLSAAS